jgi:diguanylate cyclase (GGDEF)-like protein
MLKKFVRFFTFVDLPIRKKFLLFSFGVLFWFVAMFVISITANRDVERKTHSIVNHIVPVDRITQKVIRKLRNLNADAAEISSIPDFLSLEQKIELSRARIKDIQSFAAALKFGGQIADLDRDNNKLLESFTIPPANKELKAVEYVNSLQPQLENLNITLSDMSNIRANISIDSDSAVKQLTEKLDEYKQLLASAISLSNEFSLHVSELYALNYEKIEYATNFTFYTFIGVLLIAIALLVIFTISISASIEIPVRSIIEQIRSLGAGNVELTEKITIRSKDEIGLLSKEFNALTEQINDVVTFKKVIEEDFSLEDVYTRLGKAFTEKCGLEQFIVYEVSGNQNKMKPVYPIILNDKEIYCNEEILSDSEQCKVKKTGHSISSAAYSNICKMFKPELDKVHLCVPMIVGGKTGGVIQFLIDGHDYSSNGNEKKIFRAEQYIKESLSVIEAKRLTNTLRESALKDPLTGLYNRRFLQEYTETLVAGVLRRKKNVGLIMCDLDYFKQVNDTHGHNAGDSVLKETSNMILKCVRAADLVIRFGGEEFLVLLLDINEGESVKIAEKIRETFDKGNMKIPDGTINKTISLGVSEFPLDTESFWQSIKFADVALYKAKDTGRNKAVRFNEEMWSGEEF